MKISRLHPAGLLFLLVTLFLVSGCRGDDDGFNPLPAGTQPPVVVAEASTGTPRPTETPERILSAVETTGIPAQTGVAKTSPTRPVQASPAPQPPTTPSPTATSDPVDTDPVDTATPVAHLPTPAPTPAPNGIYDYVAVTTGRAHTCLLRNDKSVLCTGTVDGETPFPSPAVSLESISSGPNHACGIDRDGSAVCWGSNDLDAWYGETSGQADPPEGAFISISAGGAHTCGIKSDGSAACWGLGEFGEADPPGGNFISVSAGWAHTCGIRPDDTLVCWGNDEFGQSSPPPGSFRSVSSGPAYSCGLRTDGEVVCWGLIWSGEEPGENGQCIRLCTYTELRSEEEADEGDVSFLQVHVGFVGSCGVTTGNSLRCWGFADDSASTPPEGEYIGVSVGVHHACSLRTDGAAVCWALESGEDVPGADSLFFCLGDAGGGTTCPGQPEFGMEAMYQSGRVISWEIFSHNGTGYTCGHRLDDSLVCWNDDLSAFVDPVPASVKAFAAADADTACWLLPDQTVACWVHDTTWLGQMSMPEGKFRSISLDETVYSAFGCGIRTDGTLSCWGDDDPDWGHLDPPSGEYKAVSTGYGHGCAIRLDDTLMCWGNHHIGTPPEGTFRYIDGSGLMHCGVRTDHSVACWGRDSSSIDLSEFLEGAYQSVAVGKFSMVYVCGVRLDGILRCQGNHQTGEISPPPGLFRSVSPGGTHACGVRVDGTVACWGTHEEAYEGDASQLTAPVGEFRSVSVGGRWNRNSEFSCGIRTSGSLTCWGRPASATLDALAGD